MRFWDLRREFVRDGAEPLPALYLLGKVSLRRFGRWCAREVAREEAALASWENEGGALAPEGAS